jgi:hypothetical protein
MTIGRTWRAEWLLLWRQCWRGTASFWLYLAAVRISSLLVTVEKSQTVMTFSKVYTTISKPVVRTWA